MMMNGAFFGGIIDMNSHEYAALGIDAPEVSALRG